MKHVRNGGILVGCDNADDVSKIKNAAEKNLSSDYEVRVLKSPRPSLRMVGFEAHYDEASLLHFIQKQNASVVTKESECEVVQSAK